MRKKFLQLSMFLFYCILCCMEIYIMWSGKKLDGSIVSYNIIDYRQNLYRCRTVLEWVIVCVFLLNHIDLLCKAEKFREGFFKMLGEVLRLMGISALAVIVNFLFSGSIDGWLNLFEPLYMIMIAVILLFIFGMWKDRKMRK